MFYCMFYFTCDRSLLRVSYLDHNADAEAKERFREVDHFLAICCDRQRRNGKISLLDAHRTCRFLSTLTDDKYATTESGAIFKPDKCLSHRLVNSFNHYKGLHSPKDKVISSHTHTHKFI